VRLPALVLSLAVIERRARPRGKRLPQRIRNADIGVARFCGFGQPEFDPPVYPREFSQCMTRWDVLVN